MHAKLCAIKQLKNCLIFRCKKMTNAHGINGETFNGTNTFYKNWPQKILNVLGQYQVEYHKT
jgi:hypothetical protein